MSFFSKVKEIIKMVFGTTFTSEETKSHDRLCKKFIRNTELNESDLREIKLDLIEISEDCAHKTITKKMNRLIKIMKIKNSDECKIKNEKEYKKFIKKEFKRVYDLSNDKVKRVKNIIKNKKHFIPEYDDDVQFVILPSWMDMDKKLYIDLAKKLTLDKIMDNEKDIQVGNVPVDKEAKWFSEKNVKKLNKFFDRHSKNISCCNLTIKDFIKSKENFKVVCKGCVEYKANMKFIELKEKYDKTIEPTMEKKLQVEEKKRKKNNDKRKDLFDIKEKSICKRPRLKKLGFEFPHIVYSSTPNGIYHPQIFHPLQLARTNFHKRHPRFKKFQEKQIYINDDEIEAERAYRKLLRKRYKKEVEMVEDFIKDPVYFKDDIPDETCTMVLNVNCEENRILYEKCLKYAEKKQETLSKYNLTDDLKKVKLKREINLDEDLSAQNLEPLEVYNELKILNEESKCMDEEDFPEDWYTNEKESDIEDGEGRIYSSKIETTISNPKFNINNKMEEVVDTVEEIKTNDSNEEIETNNCNEEVKAIDCNEETKISSHTIEEEIKNESVKPKIVTNDAYITVDLIKKNRKYVARKPAPKIQINGYEQICKAHDAILKKRQEDDAAIERIGQKASLKVKEYIREMEEKEGPKDIKPKIDFLEHIKQDNERKKREQEANGMTNKSQNTENHLTDPNAINIPNTLVTNIENVGNQHNNSEVTLSFPNKTISGIQNIEDKTNVSLQIPEKNYNQQHVSGGVPISFRNNQFFGDSKTNDTMSNCNKLGQADILQNKDSHNFTFTATNSNQNNFSNNFNNPIFGTHQNNDFSNLSSLQNTSSQTFSNNNILPHDLKTNPDNWRPEPRFGGPICSPLELPKGPFIKLDPLKHGPWGPINLPKRDPPKDEDYNNTFGPMKRKEISLKNIPKVNNLNSNNQINSTYFGGNNAPIMHFQAPNSDYQNFNIINNIPTVNNPPKSNFLNQVSSQDIFNTNRGTGMFDHIINQSKEGEEEDTSSTVQYRNMNEESNNGFNFFFK